MGKDTWQIVVQDGQSIQTYIWNTFTMRQQLKNCFFYGKLKIRFLTHWQLLRKLK